MELGLRSNLVIFKTFKTLDKMHGFYLSKLSIKCMVLIHFIFPTLSHKASLSRSFLSSRLAVGGVAM